MYNIQELINSSLKENRPNKIQTTWHPSSLGQCLTGAFLTRKGVCKKEFDDRTLRVFKCGNLFENFVIDLIEKSGVPYEKQVRCESEEMNMSGYIDIVVDGVPFEIKSKHSRSFHYMDKQGAPVQHKMQLWSYLKMKNLPRGDLLYISKDDLCLRQYSVFLDDKDIEKLVMDEIHILHESWRQGLPPKPIEDKFDWRYKYCSCHKEHCLKQPEYATISLP